MMQLTLRKSFLFLLVITVVGSLLTYRIVVRAYEVGDIYDSQLASS